MIMISIEQKERKDKTLKFTLKDHLIEKLKFQKSLKRKSKTLSSIMKRKEWQTLTILLIKILLLGKESIIQSNISKNQDKKVKEYNYY